MKDKPKIPLMTHIVTSFPRVLHWIYSPTGSTVQLRSALLDRVRDILPADVQFDTAGNGGSIAYQAPRGGGVANPFIALRFPFPPKLRLNLAVMEFLKLCQMRVRMMAEPDWPAVDAVPHVQVGSTEIRLWYGSSDDESTASVRIQPISRSEINL